MEDMTAAKTTRAHPTERMSWMPSSIRAGMEAGVIPEWFWVSAEKKENDTQSPISTCAAPGPCAG